MPAAVSGPYHVRISGRQSLEEPNAPNIKIPWNDSILDTVRERPGMYVGVKSLTALWYFLQGYEMGRCRLGEVGVQELPRRFADWVAYRLHLASHFDGFWHRAILSRVRDEAMAFDRFYELRDEFDLRKPKIVATVREDRREYPIVERRSQDGLVTNCLELLPKSLRIVVYTDDPGFFLEADASENFFFNGWFFCALDSLSFPTQPDRFKVHEEGIWQRLLKEHKRYRKNLNRVRARIQKKKNVAHITS